MIRITFGKDIETNMQFLRIDNTETVRHIAFETSPHINPPFGGIELPEEYFKEIMSDLLSVPKVEYPSDYADALRYQMALQEHEELEQCERVGG